MGSVRLEKARESYAETERQRIARLMTCPYLEEELGGVQERGVRLPVERLAKNSKIPKAILFANAALAKQLQKQSDLLDSAKHHRLIVLSWTQRQFFLRQLFDGQSNFRFASRKLSSAEIDFSPLSKDCPDCTDNFSEIFDCFVTKMTKAAQSTPINVSKGPRRALSVTICETPTSCKQARQRPIYSAPARAGRTPHTVSHAPSRHSAVSPYGPPCAQAAELPNWYSCLATKPWMLSQPVEPKRKRVKSGHSTATSRRPSSTVVKGPNQEFGPLANSRQYDDASGDVPTDQRKTQVCDSMRKWVSFKNRAVLKRILPTLPDKALQKMLDLFGEDIEEQKRFLQTIAQSLATRNALNDKRWRNLETTLKALQNE